MADKKTSFAGRPRRGKQRRVVASFTLPPEIIAALTRRARSLGRSKSETLEEILEISMARGAQIERLNLPVLAISRVCKSYNIKKLSLFGSALKGKLGPTSDIDLLVEFEPSSEPSLLGLANLEIELSSILNGKPIDLRTAEDLSEHFREKIKQTAVPIYG
jgi:predicted nucleotidyltransferase